MVCRERQADMVSAMSDSGAAAPPSEHPIARDHDGSIKETLISLVISFVMALVFRSYVVEAFIIPTGSMAPTLLGAHMEFRSPQSGFEWAVNPWYDLAGSQGAPAPIQGVGPYGPPAATDPMSAGKVGAFFGDGRRAGQHGFVTTPAPQPLRAGDRILVQKYLYVLVPPKRFDVVVFKNPEDASQNFIKRLVGLPNEQIWIADGDVFTRPVETDESGGATPVGPWKLQRKPVRVQEDLWWPLYSSEYAPLESVRDGRRWFRAPWRGDGWQIEDRTEYRRDGADASELHWDTAVWPITNWTPYNEVPQRLSISGGAMVYPVADLRMTAGVRPDAPGMSVAAVIASHAHEFRASIADSRAMLQMRRVAPGSATGVPWTDMISVGAPPLEAGRVTNIEFWRVDQSLHLIVDGQRIAYAEYEWDPSERLLHATGVAGDQYEQTSRAGNQLIVPQTYEFGRPQIHWSFSGSPVTLSRVGVYRDLFYEPTQFNLGGPGLATHPRTLPSLGPDQYFVLGDNSPSSKDGRLWDTLDADVREQIDPTIGVVPRKLLLGKAFFVYFPAPYSAGGRIPIPNMGKVRFIH